MFVILKVGQNPHGSSQHSGRDEKSMGNLLSKSNAGAWGSGHPGCVGEGPDTLLGNGSGKVKHFLEQFIKHKHF